VKQAMERVGGSTERLPKCNRVGAMRVEEWGRTMIGGGVSLVCAFTTFTWAVSSVL